MTVKLHYQSYGEGPPLYLLHGLFGSNRNWFNITRQMTAFRRIIAVDLRNHGDSGHADSMSYPEMAADLSELAASLGHSSFDLLGHSLGGKTAMTFALLYPSMLGKLIVVEIAPVRYDSMHDELISIMQNVPVANLASRNQAGELMAEHVPDPMLRQFLLQNLVRYGTGYKWRINLEGILKNYPKLRDFPAELNDRKFNGSSLFLVGERSDYVQPEHHAIITRLFPAAGISTVENAAHWVHADQPEAVARAVRDFLES
jgi:pimeloyl-ACP methyl ester carboxylesterase